MEGKDVAQRSDRPATTGNVGWDVGCKTKGLYKAGRWRLGVRGKGVLCMCTQTVDAKVCSRQQLTQDMQGKWLYKAGKGRLGAEGRECSAAQQAHTSGAMQEVLCLFQAQPVSCRC
jgi:hypothetical protein